MMLHQHPGGLVLTKRVIDYCAFPAEAKVVDVGCGAGITVEYLRDCYGLEAYGVDLSEPRLAQGRNRSAGLPLIKGAGERLPFADASVDGAIAECSLSVMPNAAGVVSEVSRILVDGGKLGITDLYIRNPGDPSAACLLPRDGRNLASLLKENGFRIIIWVDQSVFLQGFVARYIMEHDSCEELWQCIPGHDLRQRSGKATGRNKLGYFLLVAEKRTTEG